MYYHFTNARLSLEPIRGNCRKRKVDASEVVDSKPLPKRKRNWRKKTKILIWITTFHAHKRLLIKLLCYCDCSVHIFCFLLFFFAVLSSILVAIFFSCMFMLFQPAIEKPRIVTQFPTISFNSWTASFLSWMSIDNIAHVHYHHLSCKVIFYHRFPEQQRDACIPSIQSL